MPYNDMHWHERQDVDCDSFCANEMFCGMMMIVVVEAVVVEVVVVALLPLLPTTTNKEKAAKEAIWMDNVVQQPSNSDLQHVVDLLLEKGLSGTDVCSILTHTPSVALMRPRNSEDGDSNKNNTLEATLQRALDQVLSNTLGLRRYDARKVRCDDNECVYYCCVCVCW